MQRAHVLAGDIGGTKTHLALFAVSSGNSTLVREARYTSREFQSLEAVAADFLQGQTVAAAGLGVAGPVVDGEVRTTNLPWHVRPSVLAQVVGTDRVRLLNDLEATALGALQLPPSQLRTLQEGHARPGTIAVIAAGTGLGQAFLFWDGHRHVPAATEGSHVEFGPSSDDDAALLAWARPQFGHVSWERVVSGPGLALLFRFITEVQGVAASTEVRARLAAGDDPGAVVGEAAVAGTCAASLRAVRWLSRLYGAQAGNQALSVLSLGGVLVGGAMVLKLGQAFDQAAFCEAFIDKGRYRALMASLPVRVILEPKTALFGALHAAEALLEP